MFKQFLSELFGGKSATTQRQQEGADKAEAALRAAKLDLLHASDDIKQAARVNQREMEKTIKELRDVAREISRATGNT